MMQVRSIGARRFVATMFFALALAGCKPSAPKKPITFHRYGIEHARIHFEFSGYVRGTEDLFFDQWGNREARVSNFEHLDEDKFTPAHVMKIQNGDEFWVLQMASRTGEHARNLAYDSVAQVFSDSNFTAKQASENQLRMQHGVYLGKDTIGGVVADLWDFPRQGRRLWIWNAVTIKSQSQKGEETVICSPVLIDTTTPVNPLDFVPPAGYTIKERPEDAR